MILESQITENRLSYNNLTEKKYIDCQSKILESTSSDLHIHDTHNLHIR